MNTLKINQLSRLLSSVEMVRALGGNWIGFAYATIKRFPEADQVTINKWLKLRQKKNHDVLSEGLKKVVDPNPKGTNLIEEEIARQQNSASFNAAINQMEIITAGELMDYMWGIIDSYIGEEG